MGENSNGNSATPEQATPQEQSTTTASSSMVCGKDCVHYSPGTQSRFIRWGFVGLLVLGSIFALVFYLHTQRKFAESHDMIIKQHEAFCRNIMSFQNQIIPKDSLLLVDNTILYAIKEENDAIKNHLELQYHKIGESYSILTIWASALMIVFLIFSIYSMYKVDEIQNHGRESLDKIYQLHQQSQVQFTDLEKRIQDEQTKLISSAKMGITEMIEPLSKSVKDSGTEITNLEGSLKRINKDADKIKDVLEKYGEDIKKGQESLKSEIDQKKSNIAKEFEKQDGAFNKKLNDGIAKAVASFKEEIGKEYGALISQIKQKVEQETSAQQETEVPDNKYQQAFEKIDEDAQPSASDEGIND